MGKQCIFLSTFIAIKVAYVMKLSFTHLVCEQKQLGIFLQDNILHTLINSQRLFFLDQQLLPVHLCPKWLWP